MKIALLEDEKPAMRKMVRMLEAAPLEVETVAQLESVSQALQWWRQQPAIDLMIADIQLADGLSFDFFRQANFQKPVIFVTAFDQYAIEAFKHQSISYLLKPLVQADLNEALQKFKLMKAGFSEPTPPPLGHQLPWEQLQQLLKESTRPKYQDRFMVKVGEHIRSVATPQIAYFFAEGRNAFLVTLSGDKYNLDYKLEDLELLLDPAKFYRPNRSFIVQFQAITDVLVYSGSRLKIMTHPPTEKEVLVSREKVNPFKDWFNGIV